jgi:hypothetical protein
MRVVGDSFRRLILLGLLVLLGATPVTAMTFTLWDKFPLYQGQNNFYAYGYQFSEGVYRQLTRYENPEAYVYYTPEQPANVPYVGRRDRDSIYFHPSSDYTTTVYPPEDAVLAWTVTETNIFRIFGAFKHTGGSCGDGVIVYIRQNNNTLWSQTINETEVIFELANISLKAGDILYFGVNVNSDVNCDETELKATLQTPDSPGIRMLLLD